VDCGGGGGCSFSLLQREMCFAAEETKRRRRERVRAATRLAGCSREKREEVVRGPAALYYQGI